MSEEKAKTEEVKQPGGPSEAMSVLSAGGPDVAAASAEADEKARKKARARSVPAGIAFIKATFNNTIVSIADARGGVIAWSSAGKAGFKG